MLKRRRRHRRITCKTSFSIGLKLTPHMIRRYFGNIRYEAGWALELISYAYGHRHHQIFDSYLQKQLEIHHDPSVEEEISEEIISKLKHFSEHLRSMYLHLWAIGMRASEVCSLKGNAYSWDGQDAWIMVWQPKMRRYKKVPIPETLYRLMMVYIKKYGIEADDYLFPNSNRRVFCYETLRSQMLRYCDQYQLQGGEYIFQSHDYRHTVATEFYDEGVALSSVRDYHGHAHDEMTLQYVDYMSKGVKNAAEQVFKNPENNLELLPTKGLQTEFFEFLKNRSETVSSITIYSDLWKYNRIAKFLNKKAKKVKSFQEKEQEIWLRQLRAWMLNEGYQLISSGISE